MFFLLKTSRFNLLAALFGLGLLFTSCGCEEDCASFENFQLCDTAPSEDGCDSNIITFSQDADFITASVEILDANPTDRLTLTLFVNDNGNLVNVKEASKMMSEFESIDGDEKKIKASIGFPRNTTSLLPISEYQVQLELSQETIPLIATQTFNVQ